MSDTTTNNGALQTTTLSAPDISCGGCANAIRRSVGALGGVADVSVDVAAKTVTVRHDAVVGGHDLLHTLELAGFPATVQKASEASKDQAVKSSASSCSCCQSVG